MWLWVEVIVQCACSYTPLEYYNLVNVSKPVVASYNTTHSAITLTISIKLVSSPLRHDVIYLICFSMAF